MGKRKKTERVRPKGFFNHDGETFPLFEYGRGEKKHLCLDGRSVGTYLGYSSNNLQNKEVVMANGFDRRPMKAIFKGAWEGKVILFRLAELQRMVCNAERKEKLLELIKRAHKGPLRVTLDAPRSEGLKQETLFDVKERLHCDNDPSRASGGDDNDADLLELIAGLLGRLDAVEARLDLQLGEIRNHNHHTPTSILPTDQILDAVEQLVNTVNQIKQGAAQ